MKLHLKNIAIGLRKNGLSYSEILDKVNVSRSTLSLWLRSVDLSKRQKQRLTLKKLESALRGANAKRQLRIERELLLRTESCEDIKSISENELFLIGVALYWAEGTKKSGNRSGCSVVFSNSDSRMVGVYLEWLRRCIKIEMRNVWLELYIHESRAIEKEKIMNFWISSLDIEKGILRRVCLKKNRMKMKRVNSDYVGLVKVIVKNSTDLNRKISGWIDGIHQQCGIV